MTNATPATLAVQSRRLLGSLSLLVETSPRVELLIDRAYARWHRRCDALAQAEQTEARIARIIGLASRYDMASLGGMPTADLEEAKASCTSMAQYIAFQHLASELRRRETFARCMAMGPASAPKPRYVGKAGRVGHTALSTGRRTQ